jgi:formate hydrogenlyase subunit 3/multisubunit Na+/H+ antiporter MnhD subunit
MATAFLGSYMTMRGIGIMAGGFPNEYVLINEIESGAIDNIDPVFYAYLAGIFVMTIIAAIVQFKMFKKQKEEESHPYAQLN